MFGISTDDWNNRCSNIKSHKDFYDFCEWLGVNYKKDGIIYKRGEKYDEFGKKNRIKNMEEEKYKRAVEIKDKIYSLQKNLEDLKGGHWDKTKIELKTGYSDMGMDITRSTVFEEEIGYKIRDFINGIIGNKIAELEKEFKSL